jgi:hypothetical protein
MYESFWKVLDFRVSRNAVYHCWRRIVLEIGTYTNIFYCSPTVALNTFHPMKLFPRRPIGILHNLLPRVPALSVGADTILIAERLS